MSEEEDTTTLGEVWGLLFDILQELRELNGKARSAPDINCRNCGEFLDAPEHKNLHAVPSN